MIAAYHVNRERALEWLSSATMILFGFILAQQGDTLATPNFQEFAAQGLTEERLAWIFGVIGSARLVILTINGRWPRTPAARVCGAVAGFVVWSQTAALFGVSWWFYGIGGTGFGTYGLFAIAELFSIAWAAFDVRYQRR